MLLAHGKDNPIPSENRLFHFIALDSKTFCSYGEPRRIEPRRVPIDRAFPSRAIDSLICAASTPAFPSKLLSGFVRLETTTACGWKRYLL